VTAILKILAGAASLCALLLLYAAFAGVLLFAYTGAIMLLVFYTIAILLFLVLFAGYATGTLAATSGSLHPVAHAVIAATLLCLVLGITLNASPIGIDAGLLALCSIGVIGIAGAQAQRRHKGAV
jgi:hypothetical protein